ncbi:hypothetical protein LTS17_000341 [Exophiala oligosperma]
MSLYYDAATVLTNGSQDGSFKSRIYGNQLNLKSKPAHIYALISETAKFNHFVKEVIDHADLLSAEPKLNPILSLLLVHDHFFSKGGIAAPANHPLRQSIDRHKARLQAEFTKARLRRKCATTDALKELILLENPRTTRSQPRWIRVNTLKSTLAEQLTTTFRGYRTDASIHEISQSPAMAKVLAIDQNIPDVLALPPESDFTKTQAYKDGKIILQDKASCFPAYLLAGSQSDRATIGDCIDGCAAPGNKTSHLAALLTGNNNTGTGIVYACERDRHRSQILTTMMIKSGATSSSTVTVLAGQDFLKLDPQDRRFQNVTHVLLDPSCSGSGIIGREDTPTLVLPEDPRASKRNTASTSTTGKNSKKRKRQNAEREADKNSSTVFPTETTPGDAEETNDGSVDQSRLQKLSALQTRIVQHALSFPAAVRVTYSTCSVHVEENEAVVSRILDSDVARTRGWDVLKRHDQVSGLRSWKHRGRPDVKTRSDVEEKSDDDDSPPQPPAPLTPGQLEACIRCHPDDEEGTMGFFVCGFVRDPNGGSKEEQDQSKDSSWVTRETSTEVGEPWEGFGD